MNSIMDLYWKIEKNINLWQDNGWDIMGQYEALPGLSRFPHGSYIKFYKEDGDISIFLEEEENSLILHLPTPEGPGRIQERLCSLGFHSAGELHSYLLVYCRNFTYRQNVKRAMPGLSLEEEFFNRKRNPERPRII